MDKLKLAVEALELAEKQFLFYREAHMAKPPTPDTMEKAKVNSQMANRMGETLAAIRAPEAPGEVEALCERLTTSAAAFRKHPIYTSDGDPVLLTVQADELDAAATLIRQQQAEIERLRAACP